LRVEEFYVTSWRGC